MTTGRTTGEVDPPGRVEVSTRSSDALRARITVVGTLTSATVPLLTDELERHLTAGRRYLRIDVTHASIGGDAEIAVLDALTAVHDRTVGLGGMLVFEGAPLTDALGVHLARLRSRG